jgi:hypothetical protein
MIASLFFAHATHVIVKRGHRCYAKISAVARCSRGRAGSAEKMTCLQLAFMFAG